MADTETKSEDQTDEASFIDGLIEGALAAQRPAGILTPPLPAYIPAEK